MISPLIYYVGNACVQYQKSEESAMDKFDDVGKEGKEFYNNFHSFIDKRIVLYGTGRLTQRLLTMIVNEFHIIGLMDSDKGIIGQKKWGIPILGPEEAERKADLIIINTAEIHWQVIYEQICKLKIPIYYVNGWKADPEACQKEIIQWYEEYLNIDKDCMSELSEEMKMKYLVLKKLFNEVSPNYMKGDSIVFENAEKYGYCVYGMIVYSFLNWLLYEVDKCGIEELLFLARDGYLLMDEYQEYIKLFHIANAPKAKYLAASRRMVLVAGIHDQETFEEVACHTYSGTFSGYMKQRFCVKVPESGDGAEYIVLPKDKDKLYEMMQPYMSSVMEEIKKERTDYLRYLDRMNIAKNVGIVDTGFSGRIPHHLAELLGNRELWTFYWYGDLSDENKYNARRKTATCFQSDEDKTAQRCCLEKHRILNESIFSAPYGMMQRFDGDEICYIQENVNFEINEEINQGIKQFMYDMMQLVSYGTLYGDVKSQVLWADEFLGKIVRNTKLSAKQQKRLKYKDGWFGDT